MARDASGTAQRGPGSGGGAGARLRVPGRPLVSVVTPVFNGAATLARCIESVAGQTYPNVEHLVADGGSADGTTGVLRRAGVAWWVSEPDRGIYDAINKGIDESHGEWLYFLGADDVVATPDALE